MVGEPSGEGFQQATITPDVSNPVSLKIPSSIEFQRAAVQWSYILRNRRRWSELTVVKNELEAQVTQDVTRFLHTLAISEEHIDALVEALTIEVGIPFREERVGWELRIFPWEYVLAVLRRMRIRSVSFRGSAGPETLERASAFTVVRHLQVEAANGAVPAVLPPVPKMLLIISAPGTLEERFDFESERRAITGPFGAIALVLRNPTPAEISKTVLETRPDFIHLAGCDNHQANALVQEEAVFDEADSEQARPQGKERRYQSLKDGMVLSTPINKPLFCTAERLAKLITADGVHRPHLVTCNFWNTAPRVAASLVAAGAGASLGFQDEIGDELAEAFFSRLYGTLSGCAGQPATSSILRSFKNAWSMLKETPEGLLGTGIVLWSRESCLAGKAGAEEVQGQAFTRVEIKPGKRDPREVLTVDVQALGALNYSRLHNNAGLFKSCHVRVNDPRIFTGGYVRGVEIEALLHVGSDTFPCRLTRDIYTSPYNFEPEIRVALTSGLSRALRESVHTSLYFRVRWLGKDIYQDTRRVTLLPTDQWIDDAANRYWLPSFVLPRDPAVPQIIDAARRHLKTIRDDSNAGFDGYQSDPGDEDPVDQQVRAVWSALVHEYNLGYISPPPTYERNHQRLRTPSDIVSTHHGTCIDLALLVASCLEYADIYPVIFLLNGHACCGYWRHSTYYGHFISMRSVRGLHTFREASVDSTQPPAEFGATMRSPEWSLERDGYLEVVDLIQAGELVPLETTLLTRRGSFHDAVQEGILNLRSRADFDAMINIVAARRSEPPVTPLPFVWESSK